MTTIGTAAFAAYDLTHLHIPATCTIIFECYNELGVAIDDETARILLAGLLSDTRNLTKTATQREDSVA